MPDFQLKVWFCAASHHVARLMEAGHPFVICTDDRAVFDCELSGEYLLLTEQIRTMSEKEILEMSKKGIDYAFVSEEEKKRLRKLWDTFRSQEKL